MYADFLDDPKLIALAFEDQRHFMAILACKCAGHLDSGASPVLLDRIVAQKLWIDYAIIGDVKKRLVAAGLIEENWQPIAWEKRQFRSDHDVSSGERQRRFREKQRNALLDPLHNALRNEEVTPPDTDTDTDTDTDKDQSQKIGAQTKPGIGVLPAVLPSPGGSGPPRARHESGARASRLPADWVLPRSWGKWALGEEPGWSADDVRKEAEKFRDHWLAKGGADARKVDWLATWRTWVRRSSGFSAKSGQPAAKVTSLFAGAV
jgi:hypothetical protein